MTQQTRLIMFSGGVDSTYLLWDALVNSRDTIFAHHISLRNVENRWEKELESVKKILEYFRNSNIRPFNYSESLWGFPFREYFCWDIDVVAFVASQVAANLPGNVTIYSGRVYDDNQNRLSKKHEKAGIANDILRAACRPFPNVTPKIKKPLASIKKEEIMKKLPKDLLLLTWSCRRPVNGNPCNICKACLAKKEIQETDVLGDIISGIKG